jgi:peroxiredoxin
MDTVLLLARLFLAGVFALSGITKLADLDGSRRAVAGFGVPERIARPAGIALPIAELVLAVLLLPVSTAWWGALGALLLLLGFIAGIGYNLRKGRTPDCHCFGKVHSEPIGPATLVRDGAFAAVAAIIVLFGRDDAGASLTGWFGDLSGAEQVLTIATALLTAAVGGLAWLLLQVVRQNGRLLLRIDAIDNRIANGAQAIEPAPATDTTPQPGLPVGTTAPKFRLDGIYGESQTLDALLAGGKPVMLIFSSPTCGPCTALMPDIGEWQRTHADKLTIAVIGQGDVAANRAKSAEHGLTNVLLQQNGEVSAAYQAKGTPTAVMIAANGTINSPVAAGAESIRTLLRTSLSGNTQGARIRLEPSNGNGQGGNGSARPTSAAQATAIGKPAPDINLPDLKGNPVTLADFAGSPTAVIFWNPGCGFCRKMLDDLKGWEADRPAGSPQALLISTGSIDANKEQGIASTVVLDEGFATGRAFGVSGTPSAVLVDEHGLIASAPSVGGPRVMAMLTGEEIVPDAPATPSVVLQEGDDAPPISLPDLDGNTVSLSDFKGTETLVLFWNPGCGFCQRMVDDLRAFEANASASSPRLLLISTGDIEANRQAGLQAPILIDHGFATGRAYGASGTPSAVLIDANGKIAGPLLVGAPKILAASGHV